MRKQAKLRLNRWLRLLKFRVLHANDSPHRIALGAGLGLFVAWTPLIGLHILVVLALAFLLRANKFVAIVCVWVSNPFTFIGIYYPNYLFGKALLQSVNPQRQVSDQQIREMFSRLDMQALIRGFFHMEFWRNLFELLWMKGPELWIGSVIMGSVVGLMGYLVVYRITKWYRETYPRRRFLEHQ
jgi:uncharacterized protein (DUF2062 family)